MNFTLNDSPIVFNLDNGAVSFTLNAVTDPEQEAGFRLLEDDDFRILEDGNFRLLE